MPSSYALGPHFERFVRRQVAAGRYASASEVVRAGLRVLQDQERKRQEAITALRRAIDEGLRSGKGRPGEDVVAELAAKYRSNQKARRPR